MTAPTKTQASCLAAAGGCAFMLAFPIAQAFGSIYDAWIALKLWHWFLATYFPVRLPTLAVFVGIDYLVALLFKKRTADDPDASWSKIFARLIVALAVYPTVLLASAWIIQWWIS